MYVNLLIGKSCHDCLQKDKKPASLKEQLASVTPILENLRIKKEERIKNFADVRLQIEKITAEIREHEHQHDAMTSLAIVDEHDLSMRKLNEQHEQLRALQKEKVLLLKYEKELKLNSPPL